MAQLLAILFIVALVAGWWFVQFKLSGGRAMTAPWLAFSATGVAIVFAVAGLTGYPLESKERFIDGAWGDRVIWSQVAVGIVAGLVAVYFWRRTLGMRISRAAHSRS